MAEQTLVEEKQDPVAAEATVDTNGVADTLTVPVSEVVEIEIDLDGLLIGDLEVLDRAKDGNLPMNEMITFLDRVVTGGVRKLPMRYLSVIIDRLGEAIAESTNPGN
jgi:hypothetical protein